MTSHKFGYILNPSGPLSRSPILFIHFLPQPCFFPFIRIFLSIRLPFFLVFSFLFLLSYLPIFSLSIILFLIFIWLSSPSLNLLHLDRFRCSTDILLGKNCGLTTLHVGSGVDSLSDIHNWEKSDKEEDWKLVPDFYIQDLGQLLPYAQQVLAVEA